MSATAPQAETIELHGVGNRFLSLQLVPLDGSAGVALHGVLADGRLAPLATLTAEALADLSDACNMQLIELESRAV